MSALWLACWALPALGASVEAENARLARQVAELAPRAAAIAVDGQVGDWAPFYRALSSSSAVRSVSLAPDDAALRVWVELAAPLGEDALWLALDAVGTHPFDGSLRVMQGQVRARVFGGSGLQTLPGAQLVIRGSTVELAIPWSELARHGGDLADAPGDRVRVRASRWAGGKRVDAGVSVASYRLSSRVRFDPRAPTEPHDRRPVDGRLPLLGTWFVAQGAMTDKSHKHAWAYDLVIRNQAHQTTPGRRGEGKAFAHGQPVIATQRGTVRKAVDGFADRPIDSPGKGKEANRVQLDFDDGTRVTLLHLQQGSVAVRERQRVGAGDVVGRVGNSGKSSGPHLHAAWTSRDGGQTPARWLDVVVSLNLAADDPWQRHIDRWVPAAGFFVRTAADLGTPVDAEDR